MPHEFKLYDPISIIAPLSAWDSANLAGFYDDRSNGAIEKRLYTECFTLREDELQLDCFYVGGNYMSSSRSSFWFREHNGVSSFWMFSRYFFPRKTTPSLRAMQMLRSRLNDIQPR
jgi:hypothetical protein